MKKDIVYILKNNIRPEELLYSIRSVCKNFEFNKIWFFGGCPEHIYPDYQVSFLQKGDNKWLKARSTFELIFFNSAITEDFYLFNDDFFILQPYDQDTYIYRETLEEHADAVLELYPDSLYGKRLKEANEALLKKKLTTKSYECHVPMLINRRKGLKILSDFKDPSFIFRSTYGNFYRVGGIQQKDVKITDLTDIPTEEQALVSTDDYSFKAGNVGKYIRELFPDPCEYEFPKYQPKEIYVLESA